MLLPLQYSHTRAFQLLKDVGHCGENTSHDWGDHHRSQHQTWASDNKPNDAHSSFLSTELAAWLVGSRVQWAGRPYSNRLPAWLRGAFKGNVGSELRYAAAGTFKTDWFSYVGYYFPYIDIRWHKWSGTVLFANMLWNYFPLWENYANTKHNFYL